MPFTSLHPSACSPSHLGAWDGALAEGLVLHKSVNSASENVGALPGVISEGMPPPAGQNEFYIPEQEAGAIWTARNPGMASGFQMSSSIRPGSPLSPLSSGKSHDSCSQVCGTNV